MSATLLNDVRAFIRRFVVLDDQQADALTLWAVHSHAFDAFGCTPYLAITSPEKRSGKTRLLEVLELLVRKPLQTANISDAALFRVVADRLPTLFMDEVDAIFKSGKRDDLRGLLNAGYRQGAEAHRVGGANNTELQTFPVFCPKAFAGIGVCLPDTLTDRAITIRLKRRTRDEQIERFRLREVEPEGHGLRDRLAKWLEPQRDYLAAMRPELPDELDDRAQDVWEPLLAMADLACGDWPTRARAAAIALSSGEEREDESITVRLLRDIGAYFDRNGHGAVRSADLLVYLHSLEDSPWGEWKGKPLSGHGLSRLLKDYRIKTMTVYLGDGKSGRGYKREQFTDAFARALSDGSDRSDRRQPASQNGSVASNASAAWGADGRPLTGDAAHPGMLEAALDAGRLTAAEATEQLWLHELVANMGGVA